MPEPPTNHAPNLATSKPAEERAARLKYEANRPENYVPPVNGCLHRNEPCRCRITGHGNIPSPLTNANVPTHAAAREQLDSAIASADGQEAWP